MVTGHIVYSFFILFISQQNLFLHKTYYSYGSIGPSAAVLALLALSPCPFLLGCVEGIWGEPSSLRGVCGVRPLVADAALPLQV